MNSRILLLAFFITHLVNLAFSQKLPSRIIHQHYDIETTLWENTEEELIEYDEVTDILVHTFYRWDDSLQTFLPDRKYQLEYFEQDKLEVDNSVKWEYYAHPLWYPEKDPWTYQAFGNLKKYSKWEWDTTQSDWTIVFEETFFFDEENCLIKHLFTRYSKGIINFERSRDYVNEDSCKVSGSMSFIRTSGNSNFRKETLKTHEYFDNDLLETITIYIRDFSNQWVKKAVDSAFYDNKGRLIAAKSTIDWTNHRWDYDDRGRLILEHSELVGFDIPLLSTDSTIYREDHKGKLTLKEVFHSGHVPAGFEWYILISNKTTHHYSYYCDGNIKSIRSDNLDDLDLNRSFYEYENAPKCYFPNWQPNFEYFPNPANNQVSIHTQSWEFSETKVKILDVLGRIHIKKPIDYQTTRFDLDVSILPEGLYYLSLDNGEEIVTKPIMIKR